MKLGGNHLILTIAGVGPGDPDLITAGALKVIAAADLVLIPCADSGRQSVAGEIVRAHLPDLDMVPFIFPMTSDSAARDRKLREQLADISAQWRGMQSVVLPVIGDSTLYATGAYLFDIWRECAPDIELNLIPGVSAHSLAASRAGSFLVMGEDTLTVISCTAGKKAVTAALCVADAAALYKPSALKDELHSIVASTGPWRQIIRVDRAGLPGENIVEGEEALARADEYLSITLLWR